MSDTTTTITPEERAAIRSPSERWDAVHPHARGEHLIYNMVGMCGYLRKIRSPYTASSLPPLHMFCVIRSALAAQRGRHD